MKIGMRKTSLLLLALLTGQASATCPDTIVASALDGERGYAYLATGHADLTRLDLKTGNRTNISPDPLARVGGPLSIYGYDSPPFPSPSAGCLVGLDLISRGQGLVLWMSHELAYVVDLQTGQWSDPFPAGNFGPHRVAGTWRDQDDDLWITGSGITQALRSLYLKTDPYIFELGVDDEGPFIRPPSQIPYEVIWDSVTAPRWVIQASAAKNGMIEVITSNDSNPDLLDARLAPSWFRQPAPYPTAGQLGDWEVLMLDPESGELISPVDAQTVPQGPDFVDPLAFNGPRGPVAGAARQTLYPGERQVSLYDDGTLILQGEGGTPLLYSIPLHLNERREDGGTVLYCDPSPPTSLSTDAENNLLVTWPQGDVLWIHQGRLKRIPDLSKQPCRGGPRDLLGAPRFYGLPSPVRGLALEVLDTLPDLRRAEDQVIFFEESGADGETHIELMFVHRGEHTSGGALFDSAEMDGKLAYFFDDPVLSGVHHAQVLRPSDGGQWAWYDLDHVALEASGVPYYDLAYPELPYQTEPSRRVTPIGAAPLDAFLSCLRDLGCVMPIPLRTLEARDYFLTYALEGDPAYL